MNKKILIVEDDEALRDTFQKVVQDAGFRVLMARHGLEAIDLYQTHCDDVSVVITDINMPLMKGTELIDHLRNLRPDVKIIFMSGFVSGTDAAGELLESKAVVLQKPFTTPVFLSTIREVITGQLTSGFR